MLPFKSCTKNRRKITFYYFSFGEGPALRYLYKHKGKELNIYILRSFGMVNFSRNCSTLKSPPLKIGNEVTKDVKQKTLAAGYTIEHARAITASPLPPLTAGKHHSLASDLEIFPWEFHRAPSWSPSSSCSGSASFWRTMLHNPRVIWVVVQLVECSFLHGVCLSVFPQLISEAETKPNAKKKKKKSLGFCPHCKVHMDH